MGYVNLVLDLKNLNMIYLRKYFGTHVVVFYVFSSAKNSYETLNKISIWWHSNLMVNF